jgi:uncharacterized protein YcbX
LSDILGVPVVLERAQADQHHRAAIDPATVFGDVPVETLKPGYTAATLPDSFALPPGTFFDAAAVHLVTTATLDRLRALAPASRFEVARFRPNFVIEPADGADGFIEDSWVGRTVALGEVRLRVDGPCPRCVMTTLSQGGLPKDPGVLRTAVERNGGNVGVYATVVRGGPVRRGDAVGLS